MQDVEEFVGKCLKLGQWRVWLIPYFQHKLRSKDEALQRHLSANMSMQNKRGLIEVVSIMKRVLEILHISCRDLETGQATFDIRHDPRMTHGNKGCEYYTLASNCL